MSIAGITADASNQKKKKKKDLYYIFIILRNIMQIYEK